MYAQVTPEGVSIGNLPHGDDWVKVTNFSPAMRDFRGSWELNGSEIVENLSKAKEIAHDRRRARREELMKPFDDIIAKQIPGHNAQAAEQSRADIRNADALVQDSIDMAADVATLRTTIEAYEQ